MANLFDFNSKQEIIDKNEELMNGENFWNDQKKAQAIIRETNNLKSLLDNHHKLKEALEELSGSLDELKESYDDDLKELVDEEYKNTMKDFEDYEIQVLLSGPYDDHNCIL